MMVAARRLSMVVMWCKKAERELWGLLEAGWEGAGFGSYRNLWSLQVTLCPLSSLMLMDLCLAQQMHHFVVHVGCRGPIQQSSCIDHCAAVCGYWHRRAVWHASSWPTFAHNIL